MYFLNCKELLGCGAVYILDCIVAIVQLDLINTSMYL